MKRYLETIRDIMVVIVSVAVTIFIVAGGILAVVFIALLSACFLTLFFKYMVPDLWNGICFLYNELWNMWRIGK